MEWTSRQSGLLMPASSPRRSCVRWGPQVKSSMRIARDIVPGRTYLKTEILKPVTNQVTTPLRPYAPADRARRARIAQSLRPAVIRSKSMASDESGMHGKEKVYRFDSVSGLHGNSPARPGQKLTGQLSS